MIFLIRLLVQKYKKKLLLPTTVIAILFFFVLQTQFKSASPTAENIHPIPYNESFIEQQETTEYEEQSTIFVEVKGAVHKPGVYELSQGDRVIKAIELAGGYLSTSNSKNINHAEKIVDEMLIYVPVEGEEVKDFSTTQGANDGLVDINKADAAILTTLPGIGPAKADAIIAHREGNGPFKDKQDLKKVTGIGQKTFERLEHLISVK